MGRDLEIWYITQSCRTAVAIRCKDGVVFGVEKLVISKMLEPGSNRRIMAVDRHVGAVSLLRDT